MNLYSSDPARHVEENLTNKNEILFLYALLDSDRDRFILMASLHMGFTQAETALMIGGVTQAYIAAKIKNIRGKIKSASSVSDSVII